jgi:hypothetical protein
VADESRPALPALLEEGDREVAEDPMSTAMFPR